MGNSILKNISNTCIFDRVRDTIKHNKIIQNIVPHFRHQLWLVTPFFDWEISSKSVKETCQSKTGIANIQLQIFLRHGFYTRGFKKLETEVLKVVSLQILSTLRKTHLGNSVLFGNLVAIFFTISNLEGSNSPGKCCQFHGVCFDGMFLVID